MRIAVLNGHLPDYDSLAEHTIYGNKKPYCEQHGYHLETIRSIRPKFQDPASHARGFTWSRLEHLAEMLESGKWDWVWTVGCDTLITNFRIKLEDLIAYGTSPKAEATPFPEFPTFPDNIAPPAIVHWKRSPTDKRTGKKHLLICAERRTSMQADSFLVRGSPEGAAYIRDLLAHYELYKHHVWVENQTMIDLRDKHAAITFMMPQWMMNCCDYSRWYDLAPYYRDNTDGFGNRGKWKPGDFLIHWPAADIIQRFEWLIWYYPQIVF